MAGDEHDGRSASPPATMPDATGPQVPTRGELRARWTCYCELLGLVRPRVPGSHTKAAVLCPNRKKAGDGSQWRMGDVTKVLVPAMVTVPSDMPDNVNKMWHMVRGKGFPAQVTWALCLKARSRPNPLWAQPDEEASKADARAVAKTILIPEPWESWAIRSDVVRGSWAGWQGEAAKPDVFRVRGVRGNLNYTEALKIIKSM